MYYVLVSKPITVELNHITFSSLLVPKVVLRRLPSKHRGHTLDSLDIETTRDLSKAAVKSEYHSYQYVDDNATDPGYGYAVL